MGDNKDIIDKLNKASNIIANKSRNGSNYIIVSSQISDLLNELNESEQKRKEREKKLRRILGSQK